MSGPGVERPTWATAIVTGGASGIGAALVHALAAAGSRVVVADLHFAAARVVAEQVGGDAVSLDVRDAAAVEQLVARIDDEYGLDLLCSNAGIAIADPTPTLDPVVWQRIFDVNVFGVVNGCRAALPRMMARGSGAILNTASLAGLVPSPGMSAYTASKHAVVGMTLSLRADASLAGVTVSALCPGWVETPMLDVEITAAVSVRELLPAFNAGEPVTAESVANAALLGLARGDALIVEPASARHSWQMMRDRPEAVEVASRRAAAAISSSMDRR